MIVQGVLWPSDCLLCVSYIIMLTLIAVLAQAPLVSSSLTVVLIFIELQCVEYVSPY